MSTIKTDRIEPLGTTIVVSSGITVGGGAHFSGGVTAAGGLSVTGSGITVGGGAHFSGGITAAGGIHVGTTVTGGLTGGISSSLLPTGSVLQVVYASRSTEYEITSSSYAATGLSASIAPQRSNSRIIVICSVNLAILNASNSGSATDCRIVRGGTTVQEFPKTVLAESEGTSVDPVQLLSAGGQYFLMCQDTPNTTSSTNYSLQAARGWVSAGVGHYLNYASSGAGVSTMILVEIAV